MFHVVTEVISDDDVGAPHIFLVLRV